MWWARQSDKGRENKGRKQKRYKYGGKQKKKGLLTSRQKRQTRKEKDKNREVKTKRGRQ